MRIFEILIFAVILSADAFACAVCKGLALGKAQTRFCIKTGVWFGLFQAFMPLSGYIFTGFFEASISRFSGIISFALLILIGFGMIKDSFSKDEVCSDDTGFTEMLLLSTATSIDAFASGVSFALIPGFPIIFAAVSIGVITFLLSALGVKLGSTVGTKYNRRAKLAGGIILVLLGFKIFLQNF